MHIKYLIVGNGVAGVNAAKTLAQTAGNGEIAIYAQEPYHYYNRWQLPAFLAGEKTQDELCFYPAEWYDEQGIRVELGNPVIGLDSAAKQIRVTTGQVVSYDHLLLATGGRSFLPPIPGSGQSGVSVLRTLDDALRIKAVDASGCRAVVIGGGLLGLEAAHCLHASGWDVTVVEMFPRLLPRQLDEPGSAILQLLFERLGIHVVTGVLTTKITGGGVVTGVELSNGETLEAQLVLISAGMRPVTDLASDAGIAVNKGIVVNEWLETSAPDVYAAGDCAEFQGRLYGIIPAAIEQARAAARRMLGQGDEPYTGTVPSTTLKIAHIDLTAIGDVHADEDVESIRFEDAQAGKYRKLICRNGRVIGAMLLGDKANVVPVTKLIKGQVDISGFADALRSSAPDLRSVLRQAQSANEIRYECTICGYIYDPAQGDPETGVQPDTAFEDLPVGWNCPLCGAEIARFSKLAD